MDEFDDAWDDPQVQRCARRRAAELRSRGISTHDADDLIQEARRKTIRARTGRPDTHPNPIAYLCQTIASVAISVQRAHLPIDPVDPTDIEAVRGYDDPGFDEVERRSRARVAERFLRDERGEIWHRAVRRLGEPERAETIWHAAGSATETLMTSDGRRSVREAIGDALGSSDRYWSDISVSPDTLRKRVRRASPWVSYLVWEAVLVTSEPDSRADLLVRAVTETHRDDARQRLADTTEPDRRACLRAHLDALDHDLEGFM